MRRLKKMRELAGLTQLQLAMLSDVDRATLCLAETRQLKLSRAQQERVLTVLERMIRVRAKAYKPYLEVTQ